MIEAGNYCRVYLNRGRVAAPTIMVCLPDKTKPCSPDGGSKTVIRGAVPGADIPGLRCASSGLRTV